MKVFIWKRLHNLTNSYHPEGGAVVVATDLTRAIELLEEASKKSKDDREWCDDPGPLEITDPDTIVEASNSANELVTIFPDAGCC